MYHHIHVAIKSTFIAVEPFNILQFGDYIEHVEESITETSGGEDCDCEDDVCPFGYCRPDCTVDKIVDAVQRGVRHCI
mgnify:CR=1 FL=1